ncbi:MAG TPA: alpha/beta fold hydrolase [Pirellulales bacterium]|nr:alpha/beta fold hydrolase [Pirellulales bacterium]
MLVELVETKARDGVHLHGAYALAEEQAARHSAIDAALLIHGTGSNFYASSLTNALVPRLRAAGIATLAVNTRGHDLISAARGAEGRRVLGAAYEALDDCRHDLAAWIDFLVARGHGRIALVGHSLGGFKALYAQALEPHPAVAAIAALSAPRASHQRFADALRGAGFRKEYERAAELVAAGQGQTLLEVRYPVPYFVTAAGYVNKYGPEDRYDMMKFVDRLRCPTLFTYGTQELTGLAFAGVPEALEEVAARHVNLRVVVIAGADHLYSFTVPELWHHLQAWLKTLAE